MTHDYRVIEKRGKWIAQCRPHKRFALWRKIKLLGHPLTFDTKAKAEFLTRLHADMHGPLAAMTRPVRGF